jgi:hypothetical protein
MERQVVLLFLMPCEEKLYLKFAFQLLALDRFKGDGFTAENPTGTTDIKSMKNDLTARWLHVKSAQEEVQPLRRKTICLSRSQYEPSNSIQLCSAEDNPESVTVKQSPTRPRCTLSGCLSIVH